MGQVAPNDPFDLLCVAVDAACGAPADDLADHALIERIDLAHRASSRLAAERARLAALLESRRTVAIDDPRQRERERQQVRRQLAGRANRAPSQAKLDAQAGAAAVEYTATGQAFAAGHIAAEHVRVIAEVLDHLADPTEREAMEHDLLALARTARPSVFGRQARELLARRVPVSVTIREERQHRDRRVSAVDGADGGLMLSGALYGSAAETVRTALDAFRRPDLPGELRTPAQRTADALEQLCATALRADTAPARHGTRPQVLITITADQLELGEDGLARFGSGEVTTLGRLRHLLDDCSWSRVILSPDSTPIEASESVRTVPVGLWRSLLARDGGCTWAGCDAPAMWCDVAHGQIPFAAGGVLSPGNATLLCRRHHRKFDHGGYRIVIQGGRVSFHRRPSGASGDDGASWPQRDDTVWPRDDQPSTRMVDPTAGPARQRSLDLPRDGPPDGPPDRPVDPRPDQQRDGTRGRPPDRRGLGSHGRADPALSPRRPRSSAMERHTVRCQVRDDPAAAEPVVAGQPRIRVSA